MPEKQNAGEDTQHRQAKMSPEMARIIIVAIIAVTALTLYAIYDGRIPNLLLSYDEKSKSAQFSFTAPPAPISETTKNNTITPSQILSAIPQANCSSGVFYHSLVDDPSILAPENPRSCKNFTTAFIAEGGSLDAQNRLIMDQNAGQIKIDLIGEKVQWPSSHYQDNVTIEFTNTGAVSVNITSIDLVAGNNKSKPLNNDVGFPTSFVLKPKETIYVPLGSASEIARTIGVNRNPKSQYTIGDTSDCPMEMGMTLCTSYGFGIVTNFSDIFGQEESVPIIGFLQEITHLITNSFTFPPKSQ